MPLPPRRVFEGLFCPRVSIHLLTYIGQRYDLRASQCVFHEATLIVFYHSNVVLCAILKVHWEGFIKKESPYEKSHIPSKPFIAHFN